MNLDFSPAAPVQFSGRLQEHRARKMMQAIDNGDDTTVLRMLGKGLNADKVLLRKPRGILNAWVGTPHEYGNPLVEALRNENFELAEAMMAQTDFKFPDGALAIFGALWGEPTWMDHVLPLSPDALKFMLDKGLSPNAPMTRGPSRLMRAAEVLAVQPVETGDGTRKLEILLDHGAASQPQDLLNLLTGPDPLFPKSKLADKPKMQALLEARLATA